MEAQVERKNDTLFLKALNVNGVSYDLELNFHGRTAPRSLGQDQIALIQQICIEALSKNELTPGTPASYTPTKAPTTPLDQKLNQVVQTCFATRFAGPQITSIPEQRALPLFTPMAPPATAAKQPSAAQTTSPLASSASAAPQTAPSFTSHQQDLLNKTDWVEVGKQGIQPIFQRIFPSFNEKVYKTLLKDPAAKGQDENKMCSSLRLYIEALMRAYSWDRAKAVKQALLHTAVTGDTTALEKSL